MSLIKTKKQIKLKPENNILTSAEADRDNCLGVPLYTSASNTLLRVWRIKIGGKNTCIFKNPYQFFDTDSLVLFFRYTLQVRQTQPELSTTLIIIEAHKKLLPDFFS